VEFSYHVTYDFLKKSLIKNAAGSFKSMAVATVLCALPAGFLLYHESLPWVIGAAVGGLLMVWFMTYLVFTILIKTAKKTAEYHEKTPIKYKLTEEKIEVSSKIGILESGWDTFKQMSVSRLEIRLEREIPPAIFFPTSEVRPEVLSFLKDRFLSQDKKVVEK
jgi:hypothetical protein